MKTIHRNESVHTPRTRDAALRRLSRTSRWLLAGSAVLTGVLTDVAANAFPGHAKSKTAGRAATKSRAHSKHKPLTPPAEAPKATTTTEQAPPAAETTEVAPAEETPAPEQTAPTPAQEAAPEPAPVEETQAPTQQQQEALPPAEEPVVSGGS